MTNPPAGSLYTVLGVEPGCSFDELRAAYRQRARQLHPDLQPWIERSVTSIDTNGDVSMAELNEAWRVLSDPSSREQYDSSIALPARTPPAPPQPPPASRPSRRQAWVAGVQMQIVRLSRLAGRSATQTLLLKHPRGTRSEYEQIVEHIVGGLARETEARVRAARAAGAAPLDLGVAATLVGIRALSANVRREAALGITEELMMTAELLDRMWDVLAHELTTTLTTSLGGNPHAARALLDR